MANAPIVNAGIKYVNGLNLSRSAAKVVDISAGAARNSTNVNDIILNAAVSVNGAVNGANGLDTGSLAASSWYAVYIIGDSTKYKATAGLLALASASEPNLPQGYDMYRRIGWVLTDGTPDILNFYQYGAAQERWFYHDVAISEVAAGSSATFASIDVASSVPPLACQVLLDVAYTPDGATDVAEFRRYGSSASVGQWRFGYGVAGAQVGDLLVACGLNSGVPTIDYKVTASDAITWKVQGFQDYLS